MALTSGRSSGTASGTCCTACWTTWWTPTSTRYRPSTTRSSRWRTESLRDPVTDIFETALAVRGNRLNIIMKQVTSWAAIIAVPTAVTGWFGQNVDFPGKEHLGGLIESTVLILGLSGSLYLIFKRKGWI